MKKNLYKKGSFVMAYLLASSMLLTGCGNKQEAVVMNEAINVNVADATKGTLAIESKYVGTITSGEAVNVIPLVSGVVEEVYAQVGSTVEEGDLLCQFDDSAARLNLESANAGLKSAQAGYNTAVQTYENAVVSSDISLGSSWDITAQQTQDGIDTLQQSLDSARKSLTDYKKDKEDADAQAVLYYTQMETAKNDYIKAETKYQTAVELSKQYAALGNAPVATGGNAGATGNAGAMGNTGASGSAGSSSGAGTTEGTGDLPAQFAEVLASAGLTINDISESGIASLQQSAQQSKQNFSDLATAYNGMLTKSTSYESAIETLETNIETMELNLEQAKELQQFTNEKIKEDSKIAADSSLEVAKTGIASAMSGIETAQAGVEAAEYQVSLYSVEAPISGTISVVNVEANNMFSNNVAFVITNPGSKMVTFYVTDEVVTQLTIGQDVSVENRGVIYDGKITEIGISVDMTMGLFKVKALLNDAENLADYSNVTVTTVAHVAENEIIVPYDAVYFENGEAYVYVTENGTAYKRDVVVSIFDKEQVAISEGVEPGERIITSWAANLREGSLINEVSVNAE